MPKDTMPQPSTVETSGKKAPKHTSHLEIHPKLGGGTTIKHVYSSYEHQPREYHFGEGEGHRALAHIARHAGLPMEAKAADESNASRTEEEISEKEHE